MEKIITNIILAVVAIASLVGAVIGQEIFGHWIFNMAFFAVLYITVLILIKFNTNWLERFNSQ